MKKKETILIGTHNNGKFKEISNLINKKSTLVQESLSDLSTYSQESFSGISVLKSFNIQNIIFNRFDKYAFNSF